MIPLFMQEVSLHTGVNFPSQWSYVMTGITQNLRTARYYWRCYDAPMKPNQTLIRWLETLDVPMSLSTQRYYDLVSNNILAKSKAHNFTSSLNRGKPFSSVFYGRECVEYLLATDTPFDPDEAHEDWKDLQAVRVLMHPKSDLLYVLPKGESYSTEEGLAVIEMNLPLLAIQYRAFVLSQAKEGGSLGTQQFINRYVLPNMLASQTTLAIFNRLLKRQAGATHWPLHNSLARNPFQGDLGEYRGKLDNVLDDVLAHYAQVDPVFIKLLENTPSLGTRLLRDDNLLKELQLPDVAMTSQVEWLMVASRLKVFHFLINITKGATLRANQMEINQLLRTFRDPHVAAGIDNIPNEAGEELSTYVQQLLQIAQRTVY
jgi:hypothetical protein